MEKYLGQYRIPSARASWHYYAAPADYFITICTAGRECLFCHIIPETVEMISSSLGKIVAEAWHQSFILRTELFCDAFIIMPNHLHAIVTIASVETHSNASQTQSPTTHTSIISSPQPDSVIPPPQPETHYHASLQNEKKSGIAYRPPHSLSTFISGFKGAVTRRINGSRHLPTDTTVWQTRFHDHIIRNARGYDGIKNYIETNPNAGRKINFMFPVETHGNASHTQPLTPNPHISNPPPQHKVIIPPVQSRRITMRLYRKRFP